MQRYLEQILTTCYDSFLSSVFKSNSAHDFAYILKINLSVILRRCVCVCEGRVLGNEKAGSCPVSLPAKSTESPISDIGHTADLLMETDGLSSGVYAPPPSTATPHPPQITPHGGRGYNKYNRQPRHSCRSLSVLHRE